MGTPKGSKAQQALEKDFRVGAKTIKETGYISKRESLGNNDVVKAPIARLGNEGLPSGKKSNVGRKKKYTPTRMRNGINEYFQWCEDNDRVPSIKGLMIHLKMYRDQFYMYSKYPEFSDIMEQARLIIAEWCENDVYQSKGLVAGKIAYMKNVHDWSEKVESNVQQTTTISSVDEARAKLELLAPKLLEALKNSGMINQLIPPVVEAEVVAEEKPVIEYNLNRV